MLGEKQGKWDWLGKGSVTQPGTRAPRSRQTKWFSHLTSFSLLSYPNCLSYTSDSTPFCRWANHGSEERSSPPRAMKLARGGRMELWGRPSECPASPGQDAWHLLSGLCTFLLPVLYQNGHNLFWRVLLIQGPEVSALQGLAVALDHHPVAETQGARRWESEGRGRRRPSLPPRPCDRRRPQLRNISISNNGHVGTLNHYC